MVTQDLTHEEGTGVWTNMETVNEHIPAPTLAVAHFLRLASGDRAQRIRCQEAINTSYPPQALDVKDKAAFLEDLRQAVYAACLASYIQGFNLIVKTNQQRKWNIRFDQIVQMWKAGCIIKADYISEVLLEKIFTPGFKTPQYPSGSVYNMLCESGPAADLAKCKAALQRIVGAAVTTDHVVPSLSASLEYIKYQTSLNLPTQFYEAELDYFGKHMYDRKDENQSLPITGKHHYEWNPA